MYKILTFNFLFVATCYAGGKGSVSDLLWPAVNFTVLFGFLFYKLKDQINEGYKSYSVEIESSFNSAKIAEEKARNFLNEQKNSRENSESLMSNLESENNKNWENQRKILESEFEEKTKKVYSDFENKLVGERKKVESEISSNLLEKIIEKTSIDISKDPESKSKAMRKFLQ